MDATSGVVGRLWLSAATVPASAMVERTKESDVWGSDRYTSNRSYSASTITTFLHGWPHYTKSFSRYDPHPKDVVDNPSTWGETVQVIAVFISLLSVIYLLIDFITRCYGCFFRPKHPITPKHYQRRRIAAYVMAGISLAAAAVAAKTSGDVTGAVHQVAHALDDTIAYHDTIIKLSNSLVNRMEMSRVLVHDIVGSKELPTSMEQRALETEKRLLEAQMDTLTMLSQAPNVTNIRDAVNTLEEVNRHRGWATAAILFACALTMALLLLSAHLSRRKAKCYCPLQLLSTLLFCATWGAAAVTVALSVGVGDVCMEPQAYTTEVAEHHATHYEQTLVEYYLKCLPATQNPLADRVISANITLAVTHEALIDLQNYASAHSLSVLSLITQLKGNVSKVDGDISRMLSLLDCGRVHNNYYDVITIACHDFSSSFFVLALFTACVSLFLAIFRGCLPARKPPPSRDETAYDEMDDDDFEVDPNDEGYEEERPADAFQKSTLSTGSGNGSGSGSSNNSRLTSSPRMVSSGSPRVAMPSTTTGTIASSPSRSLLRASSGVASSPHDHAAYVYLPNVTADDEYI